MTGNRLPQTLIAPEEAIDLFRFAHLWEIYRAEELYNTYKAAKPMRYAPLWEALDKWDLMSLLSFVYDAGRVQGIREERKKRGGRA